MNHAAGTDPNASRSRWNLWIDGCGGYGVWGGTQWSLGGVMPGGEADIRLRADVVRWAGRICRRGEDFFWQDESDDPNKAGRLIADGQTIPIRSSAQLLFRRPSPLSTTAGLRLAPPHRFDGHIDEALLCGDTVLIGPTDDNHIVAPHFPDRVVLVFRNGVWNSKQGERQTMQPIALGERVHLASYAMTLEQA